MSAPGRTRVALAKLIGGCGWSTSASRHLPRSTREFDCDPCDLWPNQGHWRTSVFADVHPWEGQVHVTNSYRHADRVEVHEGYEPITSWFTMTYLVRARVLSWEYDGGWELNPLELTARWVARDVATQRGYL